ncbi:GDSL esterase/lipase [Melia azedarach]|uniref:GDSL esterase/lipase n=1 Tax=Melia azedarach TaxID=155640 RepID=A0ACC1XIG3_MELAZ|nr:GDSL esterase/lipase [Melia azedarach]
MGFLLDKKQFSATYRILLMLFVIHLSISTIEAARKLQKNGTFPALIAFGDSILDTGNNNNLNSVTKCDFPPYGKDFIGGKPTGRFCNGKILTDLIAEGLGIKEIVPAYLDPNLQSKDLPTGVCFASGGSGLDPLTSSIQSVVSASDQLNNFKDYLGKLKRVVGEEKANNIISNSVFLLSFGNNDIAITYFNTPSRSFQYTVASYSSQLADWTSTFIKDLYGLGVKKVAVLGTLPLGCLPVLRTIQEGPLRVCGDNANEAAQLFNSKLSSRVKSLSSSLPQAKIVYVDVYNPLLDIIKNPARSGFNVLDNGCCGVGAIEAGPLCNQFVTSTCANVSQYVFWDSAHPSERAYRILASPIWQNLKSNLS